jgi:hypothetical protein
MRQWHLRVDVLAPLHGGRRDYRVCMVWSGHNDGVNVIFLIEHPAIVLVPFCLWISLECDRSHLPVHIAQGDDVLGIARPQIVGPHSTKANTGDVQLPAGSLVAPSAQHVSRHDEKRSRGGRAAEQLSS